MRPVHVLVACLLASAPPLVPDALAAPKADEQAAPGLVFALRTGLEDASTLEGAFRHAKAIKEAGLLAEVTVIVYGRAIVVFDPTMTLPADVKASFEGARSAGVRIVACETALRKYGIAPEDAARVAEVVPQGAVEISRLVAAGHEVLSY